MVYSGSDRYYAKRNAGIPETRKDGSKYSPYIDERAAAAERYVADFMRCKFNSDIYANKGDGGFDFIFDLSIEVYWVSNPKGNYLIVPIDDSDRWADIYVVAKGEDEIDIIGWTYHNALVKEPKKDFGYGLRYCMHFDKLIKIEHLMKLKRRD